MSRRKRKLGFSPEAVAGMFNVHLRTVFRWFERGYLISTSASVQVAEKKSTLKLLRVLEASCSPKEARSRLGNLPASTLRLWIRKKRLATVNVLGAERTVLASIDKLIEKRNTPRFDRKRYCHPIELAEAIGLSLSSVYSCMRLGHLKFVVVNGMKLIRRPEGENIISLWNSSSSRKGASKDLGIPHGTIRPWINRGDLVEVTVLRSKRILRSSVEFQKRRMQTAAANLKGSRFFSFLLSPPQTQQIYMPLSQVREFLGISSAQLSAWKKQREFKCRRLRGQLFVEVESLWIFRRRYLRKMKPFLPDLAAAS